MYKASYGYFLNLSYIHDDIIMNLIVGLKNLEGMPLGNTTNTIINEFFILCIVAVTYYK